MTFRPRGPRAPQTLCSGGWVSRTCLLRVPAPPFRSLLAQASVSPSDLGQIFPQNSTQLSFRGPSGRQKGLSCSLEGTRESI